MAKPEHPHPGDPGGAGTGTGTAWGATPSPSPSPCPPRAAVCRERDTRTVSIYSDLLYSSSPSSMAAGVSFQLPRLTPSASLSAPGCPRSRPLPVRDSTSALGGHGSHPRSRLSAKRPRSVARQSPAAHAQAERWKPWVRAEGAPGARGPAGRALWVPRSFPGRLRSPGPAPPAGSYQRLPLSAGPMDEPSGRPLSCEEKEKVRGCLWTLCPPAS